MNNQLPTYVMHADVGSEFIWPDRKGNDHDVVVVVTDLPAAAEALRADGWEKEKEENYPVAGSWRKGRNNLILTDNIALFRAFVVGAELCRYLVNHGAEAAIVQREVRLHVNAEIRALALELAS